MKHLASIALALGMSLTAAAQVYRPVSLEKVDPVDVFPYYGKSSTKERFDQYMDPVLREVVYADHAINMMYKYGTTKYTADQYKILLGKINLVMQNEGPLSSLEDKSDIFNYDLLTLPIIKQWYGSLDDHAAMELSISRLWSNHIKYNTNDISGLDVLFNAPFWYLLSEDRQIIYACSSYGIPGRPPFRYSYGDYAIESYQLPRTIFFTAISNNTTSANIFLQYSVANPIPDNTEINIACYGDVNIIANGIGETLLRNHVCVGANIVKGRRLKVGGIGEHGSRMPYGFNPDFVVSEAVFPYDEEAHHQSGVLCLVVSNPWSSPTTYTVATLMGICAQLWPDAPDIMDVKNDLLAHTECHDILLELANPEESIPSVEAMSINPGRYFRYKCMPQNLPENMNGNNTIALEKGTYPGIIFSGPGVEVKAGNEWIAVNEDNLSRIKTLNPMKLEHRFNADLATKQGYSNEVTIEVIPIDDQFKSLDLVNQHTISMAGYDGVEDVTTDNATKPVRKIVKDGKILILKRDKYYTTDGRLYDEQK